MEVSLPSAPRSRMLPSRALYARYWTAARDSVVRRDTESIKAIPIETPANEIPNSTEAVNDLNLLLANIVEPGAVPGQIINLVNRFSSVVLRDGWAFLEKDLSDMRDTLTAVLAYLDKNTPEYMGDSPEKGEGIRVVIRIAIDLLDKVSSVANKPIEQRKAYQQVLKKRLLDVKAFPAPIRKFLEDIDRMDEEGRLPPGVEEAQRAAEEEDYPPDWEREGDENFVEEEELEEEELDEEEEADDDEESSRDREGVPLRHVPGLGMAGLFPQRDADGDGEFDW